MKIKAFGIDLGSVNVGVSTILLDTDTWFASIIDACVFRTVGFPSDTQTLFSVHRDTARDIVAYANKLKPDIIGLEDFTNQRFSHVSFSIAHFNAITRTLLYDSGIPTLLVVPSKLRSFVGVPNLRGDNKGVYYKANKRIVVDWVKRKFSGQEFDGSELSISNMADAAAYAMMAAIFYSSYWLKIDVPLSESELVPFHSPPFKVKKGLLDIPLHFLIRNAEAEAKYNASRKIILVELESVIHGD